MPHFSKRLLIVTQALDQDDQVLGFFHAWVEEFAKHCESVLVVCLKEGKHALPSNVRVISLGKEKGSVSSFRYAWRFYKVIWRERTHYDRVFVHMNTEYIILAGLLWRLWNKCTVLWYAHGSVTLRLRVAVLLANRVVTSSLLGMRVETSNVTVVGQGIDPEQFTPRTKRESDVLHIVTVGRISERKYLERILPALDVLFARGILFEYSIIGAPATPADILYEVRLHSEIAKRPYADAVQFAGALPHSQLPAELQRADVLVNLSQTGSMDKVVLEAIAAEVPVISANSAFKDLLTPYGLYLEKADAQQLADMLVRAKDAPVERLREWVIREHALASLIPKILAVYPV